MADFNLLLQTYDNVDESDVSEASPLIKSTVNKEKLRVVARCTLIASLASLSAGMAAGFTSPALLELSNENQTIPLQLFDNTSIVPSVFGALELVGGMFGGILAWPISDSLGRKPALTVGGVIFLCGWLLISYAVRITGSRIAFLTVLLSGRFLLGLASGWSVFCASLYSTEISSAKFKGIFGNFSMLFYSLGILLTYFLGIKFEHFRFHYSDIALVGVTTGILFVLLMLVATYETPRWLLSKKMDHIGGEILRTLRGERYDVTKELNEIKRRLSKTYPSMKEQFLAFKQRAVFHPFILVIFIAFFRQFSGISPVIYYASQIFSEAGYNEEKAQLATFGAVGVVRLLSTIMSVVLVDCVGRRVLLMISSVGIVVSTLLLGIYFFILEGKCDNSLSNPGCFNGIEYLAISSIVVFLAAHSVGWSSIAWTTIVELLPNRIRTVGSSIANASIWFFAFIVTLSFQPYTTLVTPKFTWWTFSAITTLSVMFVALFIPEAKGRSLEEIQQHFETGKLLAVSCTCVKCNANKT